MRRSALGLMTLMTLAARSQEITDLGVVSPHRAIFLEKDTNQVDFVHFKIELVPQRWNFNTNAVAFSTTNELLTLADFMSMPPGPCIMGVRSVYSDGDESNISLYQVRVRRDPPKPPRAHSTGISNTSSLNRQTTTNLLHQRFRSRTNQQSMAVPPLPPGLRAAPASPERFLPTRQASDFSRETVRAMATAIEGVQNLTNIATMTTEATEAIVGPLPGGSSKTYSDHMVEMHDFYTGRHKSE